MQNGYIERLNGSVRREQQKQMTENLKSLLLNGIRNAEAIFW